MQHILPCNTPAVNMYYDTCVSVSCMQYHDTLGPVRKAAALNTPAQTELNVYLQQYWYNRQQQHQQHASRGTSINNSVTSTYVPASGAAEQLTDAPSWSHKHNYSWPAHMCNACRYQKTKEGRTGRRSEAHAQPVPKFNLKSSHPAPSTTHIHLLPMPAPAASAMAELHVQLHNDRIASQAKYQQIPAARQKRSSTSSSTPAS
jgi:hypothetical protein